MVFRETTGRPVLAVKRSQGRHNYDVVNVFQFSNMQLQGDMGTGQCHNFHNIGAVISMRSYCGSKSMLIVGVEVEFGRDTKMKCLFSNTNSFQFPCPVLLNAITNSLSRPNSKANYGL